MATFARSAVESELRTRHSWISNREVVGGGGFQTAVNPCTGRAFARTSLLLSAEAGSAVSAAQAAYPAWSSRSFRERGEFLLRARDVLCRRAEEVARLIHESQGKPPAEAYAVEIFPALESLKHLAENAEEILRDEELESRVILFAHKSARVSYVPYGVVLVITPWNYPLFLSLSGIAAALAAGNTVVLKPAPSTMVVGLEIGAIFREAGLPDGVLNVVAVEDGVAPALVEDPRLGKVLFVGSMQTGKKVMASAAKNMTPLVLELGGKDAAIVCRDADLDQAARGIAWGAFVNAGQTCVSVERVYVEECVAKEFVAKLVGETRRIRVGDAADGEYDVGPLTLERQRDIVEGQLADAVGRGAQIAVGGSRLPGDGFFFPPTILTGVNHSMRVMREETFGPLLPVMVVASVDEAVALANDSDYALTASAWTRDEAQAASLQRRLRAGVVSVNDCVSSLGDPAAPYGGIGRSGFGRAHGSSGLKEMAQTKYVSSDTSRRPMLWWYPYDRSYARIMATALRALHSRSLLTRLRHQLKLLTFARFRRRVSLLSLLRNADKLF